MSVLTYIYLREPERLSLDAVLNSLARESHGFAVEECELKSRASPSWSYLLLSQCDLKHLRFEFALDQNTKSNIDWFAERYSKTPNLDVVRSAKRFIWSQIKIGKASNREIGRGFDSYYTVVWILCRLSNGVVDLPEENKLYSTSGFARYKNRLLLEAARSA